MYSPCLRCPWRLTDICHVSPLFRHRRLVQQRARSRCSQWPSAGRGDWVVSQHHRESGYVAVYYGPCSELAPFIGAIDPAPGCGASPHRPSPAARTDTDLPWFHSTAGAGSLGRPTTGSLVTGGAVWCIDRAGCHQRPPIDIRRVNRVPLSHDYVSRGW